METYRAELSHTTAFFRNRPQLEEFAGALLPHVWPDGAADLRLLCYGGSTGCEAFSLLIALREFGPEQGRRILARVRSMDLVEAVTAQARQARFPAENFAPLWGLEGGEMPPAFRDRWFTPEEGGAFWRVRPELRADAEFQTGNLLTETLADSFDILVCQNVLTHLEPHAADPLLCRLLERTKPRAALVCSGVDLDLKHRIAEAGFQPWTGRVEAIHDAFGTHRMHYRQNRGRHYFELEDIDRTRPDWETRYSTLFYRG